MPSPLLYRPVAVLCCLTVAYLIFAPLTALADPLVKCPDFVFDLKKRDFRRADFVHANVIHENAKTGNSSSSIYDEIPPKGFGNAATTKPNPDGTLDIGDVAQQRRDTLRPQLLCKYQDTKIVIPLDLPDVTRVCYERGYCE